MHGCKKLEADHATQRAVPSAPEESRCKSNFCKLNTKSKRGVAALLHARACRILSVACLYLICCGSHTASVDPTGPASSCMGHNFSSTRRAKGSRTQVLLHVKSRVNSSSYVTTTSTKSRSCQVSLAARHYPPGSGQQGGPAGPNTGKYRGNTGVIQGVIPGYVALYGTPRIQGGS